MANNYLFKYFLVSPNFLLFFPYMTRRPYFRLLNDSHLDDRVFWRAFSPSAPIWIALYLQIHVLHSLICLLVFCLCVFFNFNYCIIQTIEVSFYFFTILVSHLICFHVFLLMLGHSSHIVMRLLSSCHYMWQFFVLFTTEISTEHVLLLLCILSNIFYWTFNFVVIVLNVWNMLPSSKECDALFYINLDR